MPTASPLTVTAQRDDAHIKSTRSISSGREALSPFLRLPTKLHLEIFALLEINGDSELLQLTATSRYFCQITTEPNHATLLKIEKSHLR